MTPTAPPPAVGVIFSPRLNRLVAAKTAFAALRELSIAKSPSAGNTAIGGKKIAPCHPARSPRSPPKEHGWRKHGRMRTAGGIPLGNLGFIRNPTSQAILHFPRYAHKAAIIPGRSPQDLHKPHRWHEAFALLVLAVQHILRSIRSRTVPITGPRDLQILERDLK